jgi:thaumarchaeosortase
MKNSKTHDLISGLGRSIPLLKKTLPIIGLTVPFLILYILYPGSYDLMWKGRMFYLFFLWLLFVETIINWDKIAKSKVIKVRSVRAAAFIAALALPVLYITVANFAGLNKAIVDLASNYNVVPEFVQFVPLSIEYLVLTGLFVLILSLYYGTRQTSDFAISMIFLGVIGAVYMIDTLYPWGRFTPFQIFAPTTTQLSASVLNLMGYKTSIVMRLFPNEGTLPVLTVKDAFGNTAVHPVAWVCSGVESLIIFSVTIPLFFKNSTIPWKHRVVYFIFGAAITYFINALRIATIFIIDINGGDWNAFHNVYGMLYSMTWIVSYPLLIIGSRTLWTRIKTRRDKPNLAISAQLLESTDQ